MPRREGGVLEATTRKDVVETLPPAYSISCTSCGKRFALRARMKDGIPIRCAACGRIFLSSLDEPGKPRQLRKRKRSSAVPEEPRARLKRRAIVAVGIAATVGLLVFLAPSFLSALPERQWDIEVALSGGKKATFSLYGTSADRIEVVHSSFDGGPFAADSSWKSYKDEARMLSEGGIEFKRGDESWEIRFSGEGRARVNAGGKTHWGTVVRSATLP